MNRGPLPAAEADLAVERNRIAWNLPRRPLVEVPRVSPGSPPPIPPHELASSSPKPIHPTPDRAELTGEVIELSSQFVPGAGSYAEDRSTRRRRARLIRFIVFIPVWMLGVVPLAREIIDGGANVVLVYLAVGAASLGVAAAIRGVYVSLTKRPFWSPWVFPIAALLAIAGYSVQSAGEEPPAPLAVATAESSVQASRGVSS